MIGVMPPGVPLVEVSEVVQAGGVALGESVVTAQEVIVNVTPSLGAGPSKLMVALAVLPVMSSRLVWLLPAEPAGVRPAGSPTIVKLLLAEFEPVAVKAPLPVTVIVGDADLLSW